MEFIGEIVRFFAVDIQTPEPNPLLNFALNCCVLLLFAVALGAVVFRIATGRLGKWDIPLLLCMAALAIPAGGRAVAASSLGYWYLTADSETLGYAGLLVVQAAAMIVLSGVLGKRRKKAAGKTAA